MYCFQFSDGDNWGEDNRRGVRAAGRKAAAGGEPVLLRAGRKPVRQRRVHRRPGEAVRRAEKLVLSEIADKDAIYESIKTFLGKGK